MCIFTATEKYIQAGMLDNRLPPPACLTASARSPPSFYQHVLPPCNI